MFFMPQLLDPEETEHCSHRSGHHGKYFPFFFSQRRVKKVFPWLSPKLASPKIGLYVGGCGMGDTGAKQVANMLAGALHLETLCLGHNAVSDEGASSLARALAENHALRRQVRVNVMFAFGKVTGKNRQPFTFLVFPSI